jgi:sugar/nucleoside kinase (ribokinase family)
VIWEGRTLNATVVVVARADAKIPVTGEVLQVRRARIVGAHRDYVSVPDWRDWLAGVTYLQANRQEVASLRGHPERWPSRAEIESFAAEAFAVGVRAVFVTLGKDGILMLIPNESVGTAVDARRIQAPAADHVVDTTGCGDVFCARTMSLLAKDVPLERAAQAGVVLASKAVGLAGINETYRLAREGSGLNIERI